jgi:putative membrane protein
MAERDVLGDRAAETDFEIIRMRSEDEQVNRAGHRLILFAREPFPRAMSPMLQKARILRALEASYETAHWRPHMKVRLGMIVGAAFVAAMPALAQNNKPTDAQIAHIAYTAGALDVEAGKQALAISKNPEVRAFAQQMVKDHAAVNDQALALVKKLKVTPEDNPISKSLSEQAAAKRAELAKLSGAAFDKAYLANEVAFHKTVNGALETTLIPSASNGELKSLLQTGLKLFQGHQMHAEQTAKAAN